MIDLGIGHEAAQAVAPAAPWTPTGGLSTGSGQADRPPKSGSGGGGGTAGGGGRGDSQIIQARGGEKAKVKSIKMIDRLEPPELSHVSLPFKEVSWCGRWWGRW